MREKLSKYLMDTPWVILSLMVVMYFVHTYVPIPRIMVYSWALVAFVALWATGWNLGAFGIHFKDMSKWVAFSLLYGIPLFLWLDSVVQPFCENFIAPISHDSFNFFKGNFYLYVKESVHLILNTSVLIVFGQYAYLQRRLAISLGDNNKTWLFSTVLVSLYMGGLLPTDNPAILTFYIILNLSFRGLLMLYRNQVVFISLVILFYNIFTTTLIYFDIEDSVREFFTIIYRLTFG